MAVKIEKWVVAQKKHRLSGKHVQMARELGLNRFSNPLGSRPDRKHAGHGLYS